MSLSLRGKNALVTGSSRGLGAVICEKLAAEGVNVVVNYVSSKDDAEKVAARVATYGVKTTCIQADCGVPEDNVRLVEESVERLGGLDIIIANAGWTRFADFGNLNDLSLEEWNRCWATNVMSHLQLLQAAGPVLKRNPDGGAYILTSSVAARSVSGSSMGYSVSKAAALHLMKCIAATQGPNLRINAILPGLLLTDWSSKYGESTLEALKQKAALKAEVSGASPFPYLHVH